MLIGSGVRLRAFERTDLETSKRWLNDPEVTRSILRHGPYSMTEQIAWFERLDPARDRVLSIEVPDGQDGTWTYVGNCGLHGMDSRMGTSHFGIVIGERALWGRGIGTEAARLIIDFGFRELRLHRIELEVLDGNDRARRSYDKLGFTLEGTRRQAVFRDGRHVDIHLMSVLAPEWLGGTESEAQP